jgi:hypothetical protein
MFSQALQDVVIVRAVTSLAYVSVTETPFNIAYIATIRVGGVLTTDSALHNPILFIHSLGPSTVIVKPLPLCLSRRALALVFA